MRRFAVGLLLVGLTSHPLLAQGTQGVSADPLVEVERLLDDHQYAGARAAVTRFWSVSGDSVRGDRRARALMLRAVLAESLDEAETDLLRISVEHPQSVEADRALMRLAQARTARGDSVGAAIYLERLVRDHPTSSLRSRARDQLGLRPEAPGARISPPTAMARAPARALPPDARPDAAGGELTIEIGRFSTVTEAEATRDAARAAGFSAFLARVGRSGTTLVRIGSYPDRATAESVAGRVRQAGFRAEITSVGAP